VCGVQAQDVRAAALALRCRVPGLTRADAGALGLVRTWTVRGTVHLIAEADRRWLHAACAPRSLARYEAQLAERGGLDDARAILPAMVETLAEAPRTRASLLAELAARGHPELNPRSVNVLMPWATQQGVVLGLPDGRYRAADPPPAMDEDEALAMLARRYLAGYGPASAGDLAAWSGLPLRLARRGLEAIRRLVAIWPSQSRPNGQKAEELLVLTADLEAEPPPAPEARLLPAFDTTMLGYRTREPLLAARHDRRVLRGGMVQPVLLAADAIAGTWRLAGGGRRRALEVEWFGRRAGARALAPEVADVARFLDLEIQLDD
jgi:hypothetical protein